MNKFALAAALSAFSAASFAAPETFSVEPTHTYPALRIQPFRLLEPGAALRQDQRQDRA
jgi:hypothetical protein